MLNFLFSNPIDFLFFALAILAAITIHEFAHAYAADQLGDPTPRSLGRLTLNPLAHLDPFGTLMLFIVGFGWGKPVPFDPYNLKNPRKDSAIISLAGPLSNIIFATLAAVLLRVISSPFSPLHFIAGFCELLVIINVSLAVFNLFPMHPLDGGKILVALLPPKDAQEADTFMHRYGTFILLFMLLPVWNGVSPLSQILHPITKIILNLLLPRVSFI